MNFRKFTFFFIVVSFGTLATSAQITTGEIQARKKTVEEAPKVYDGFSYFALQERDSDYKQYIGQKVYFPDFVQQVNYGRKPNAYFTITDVLYGKAQSVFEKSLGLNGNDIGGMGTPLLILKQEGSSEVNFYSLEKGLSNFVLVSYFLKQKQLHEGKSYVMVNSSGHFYDAATETIVNYNQPLYGGNGNVKLTW